MSRSSFRQTMAPLCVLCACAFLAEGLPPNEKLTQFGRQNWQTENGLPQDTIHAMLQTSAGFLWLGTDGGLVRFDGLRFTTFDTQNTPDLKSNSIQDLAEDSSGNLWFSSPEGVTRWAQPETIGSKTIPAEVKQSDLHTFTVADGLPKGRSWSLQRDPSGVVWAASPDGLARFSGGRFAPAFNEVASSVPAAPFSDGIQAFGRDASHNLWIASGASLIPVASSLNPAVHPILAASSETGKLRALLFIGPTLWLGTEHGVWNTATGPDFRHYTVNDGLPSDRITCLMRDEDGSVWVGTENGVARIAGGKVDTFPPGDPLSGDAINSLLEDREGDIWIGGAATGMTILRRQKFITYSFHRTGADPQIRCVFGTRDGSIWIGTDGGGLKRFKDGQFSTLTTADGLLSNVILSLGEQSDGILLVGTPDGLNRVQNGWVRSPFYNPTPAVAEDFIRSVFTDRDGSLWIGTRRGLSHVSGDQITTFTQSDGLGSDTVGSLLRDATGTLWVGTLHGLSRLDQQGIKKETIRNYTESQGLSGNVITDLYQDPQGSLWIATQDGGLNRYRNDSFTSFAPSLGLPRAIYGLSEDSGGDLWLAAKSGIFRVSRRALDQRAEHRAAGSIPIVAYGTSDGLLVSEGSGSGHPAVWKSNDGDLWFATANGAALLASPANSLNRVLPPVIIENISVDDDDYRPGQLKDVQPEHSRISFEYVGISFLAPQKVQYKYQLVGFDKDWIDAGTRRVAYYTNLPPNSYRFRVIARNNDGFWNEGGASLPIRILPHFYQTWWFYLLLLFPAALPAYGFYLARLRRIQSHFDAVLGERTRIAREIHDTLAQGFVAISVQLELVSWMLASSKETAREHLDQARILVRTGLAEARQSIWELRSHEAGTQDLAARLSRLAQHVTESGSAKVQLEVHGQYRPLKPAIEDEVFRIGQEAVSNAARHSGAQQIRVDLTFDSRKLRMTVADNGCGFAGEVNSQGPDGHFGLKGMRERAERIHAQLNIESNVGLGTTVSVEAPAR